MTKYLIRFDKLYSFDLKINHYNFNIDYADEDLIELINNSSINYSCEEIKEILLSLKGKNISFDNIKYIKK